MSINGIDAVTFGITNRTKSERFLDHWGLKKIRSGKFGANYICTDGTEVKFRGHKSKSLPKAIQAGSTVREVVWGVEKKNDLKVIANEFAKDRKVKVLTDGSIRLVDDIGLGIGFRISKRKKLKHKPPTFNRPGEDIRVDAPATFYERATPQMISHIVFGVPDYQVIENFYGRIGFLATDRYPGRGVFLRAAERGNHHNLFAMNIEGNKPKFNHLAFKVQDIHEVIGGGQFLVRHGWKSSVGPGRHYISSACFWYFQTPLGGDCEYCADEDIMTKNWKVREFEVGPDIFSEWTFNADTDFKAPTAASRTK